MSQSTPGDAEQGEKTLGVFSTQETSKVGTGTTTRRVTQKMYWFVEQHDENTFICQPVNAHFVPSGAKKKISKEELLSRFEPEPEFYYSSVLPNIRQMEERVDTGDRLRGRGENFAAEYSYQSALSIDEENIRANFGIGLTYLERGDTEKADNVFQKLVHLEGSFEAKHKHLFNDFGINLRKQGMLSQAATYYARAIELSPEDENLRLNLARVYCELGDNLNGVKEVLEAIRIAPDNVTAHKFLNWMQNGRLIPSEMLPAVIQALRQAATATNAPMTGSTP